MMTMTFDEFSMIMNDVNNGVIELHSNHRDACNFDYEIDDLNIMFNITFRDGHFFDVNIDYVNMETCETESEVIVIDNPDSESYKFCFNALMNENSLSL